MWLMLLLGAFLISKVVFGINFGPSNLLLTLINDGLRILVSGAVLFGWLMAWKRMTNYYFWRAIERKKSNS